MARRPGKPSKLDNDLIAPSKTIPIRSVEHARLQYEFLRISFEYLGNFNYLVYENEDDVYKGGIRSTRDLQLIFDLRIIPDAENGIAGKYRIGTRAEK